MQRKNAKECLLGEEAMAQAVENIPSQEESGIPEMAGERQPDSMLLVPAEAHAGAAGDKAVDEMPAEAPPFLTREKQQAMVKAAAPKGRGRSKGRGRGRGKQAAGTAHDMENHESDTGEENEKWGKGKAKPVQKAKCRAQAKAKAAGKPKAKAKAKATGKPEAKAKAKAKEAQIQGAKAKAKEAQIQGDACDKGSGRSRAMKRPAAAPGKGSRKPVPNKVPVNNTYQKSMLDVYWSRAAVGLKLRGTMQQAGLHPQQLCQEHVFSQVFYLSVNGATMVQLLSVMYSVAPGPIFTTVHAQQHLSMNGLCYELRPRSLMSTTATTWLPRLLLPSQQARRALGDSFTRGPGMSEA